MFRQKLTIDIPDLTALQLRCKNCFAIWALYSYASRLLRGLAIIHALTEVVFSLQNKLSTVEALAAKAQWFTPESRVELFNTIQKHLPAYRTYVMLAILGGYDSTPEEKQQLITEMTPFFTKEGGLPLFERLNKREQTLYRRYLFPERKENMEEKLKG